MKTQKIKNIGIDVAPPTEKCTDLTCPFHGKLTVRGRVFVGKVINEPLHKTAKVEFPRLFYIRKYERYEKRRTRIKVHIPTCLNVKKDFIVKIMETRPISKTKNFVVVEVIKK